jgi:hypothetical protein
VHDHFICRNCLHVACGDGASPVVCEHCMGCSWVLLPYAGQHPTFSGWLRRHRGNVGHYVAMQRKLARARAGRLQ